MASSSSAEAQEALRWRYGNVDDGNFTLRGDGGGCVPLLGALLLVLVCFVALCLYLSWACKRYYRPSRYPAPSLSSSPTSSSLARGLDDATIATLPVTMYRPGPGDAALCCPICLGEFAEGDKVKALPRCGHGLFHPDCVDPWLRARASCPLCRASLLVATKPDVVGSEAV